MISRITKLKLSITTMVATSYSVPHQNKKYHKKTLKCKCSSWYPCQYQAVSRFIILSIKMKNLRLCLCERMRLIPRDREVSTKNREKVLTATVQSLLTHEISTRKVIFGSLDTFKHFLLNSVWYKHTIQPNNTTKTKSYIFFNSSFYCC